MFSNIISRVSIFPSGKDGGGSIGLLFLILRHTDHVQVSALGYLGSLHQQQPSCLHPQRPQTSLCSSQTENNAEYLHQQQKADLWPIHPWQKDSQSLENHCPRSFRAIGGGDCFHLTKKQNKDNDPANSLSNWAPRPSCQGYSWQLFSSPDLIESCAAFSTLRLHGFHYSIFIFAFNRFFQKQK